MSLEETFAQMDRQAADVHEKMLRITRNGGECKSKSHQQTLPTRLGREFGFFFQKETTCGAPPLEIHGNTALWKTTWRTED